ncbi:MAG TPA: MFS transporter [Candidatus Hydrogenedentes bacterium]|nr:MFS transporter [Candidatus Hydrogenedentota bacterium]HOH50936.1 MFS transporter [Candidatus Hydrogenedentota bacterium]HQL95026.1 MFS transporter [Candidatus Hydrogenedentota bacterium]
MSTAALTAFSGVFALGAIFAIFGSIKLKLQEKLGIDDAKASQLISAMMFSCLVCSLAVGVITPRLGFQAVALMGFGAGALCVWLLATTSSYAGAMVAFVALGFAAMCVNTVGNVLGPQVLLDGKNVPAAQNLLNVLFGVGSFLTPLIIGNLIGKAGYKATLSLIGLLLAVPIAWTVFAVSLPSAGEFNLPAAAKLIANPAVLLGGAALFCYISLEATLGGFLTTYLADHKVDATKANNYLSLFWIFLLLARLFTYFVIPPSVFPFYVPVLAVVAAGSIMAMVTARSTGVAVVAMLATGFVMGPCFPTLVAVTFGKTGTAQGAEVFGMIFAIGLLGGIFTPRIMGGFSASGNIRKGMQVLAGMAVALVVLSALLSYAIPNLAQ